MPKDRYSINDRRRGRRYALGGFIKQRPARLRLANFPDETVEVVMQQSHRGHERESHARSDSVIKEPPDVSERTEGEAQNDICQNEESTRAEHETNEGAGFRIVA